MLKQLGSLAACALLLTACSDSLPVASMKTASKALSCDGYPRQDGDKVTACEARPITDVATQGAPSVTSSSADLQAIGSDRATISGTAYVYGTGADEERAKAIVAGVGVTAENDDFHGSPPPDLQDGESWGVGFDLQIPAASDLSASSTNGGIHAESVQGTQDYDAINGGIELGGLSGKVSATTTNGNVDLALSGTAWAGDGVSITTTNGSTSFSAPADYNAQFHLKASNGSVNSDFEGGNCNPDTTGNDCTYTLGSGGALLEADVSNGDANLRKQ